VIVIPGPVSVAGITTKDEPVADLLDRFEAAITEELLRLDTPSIAATSRSTVGAGTTLLDAASDSPDVVWAGRVIPNPLHRLEGVAHELVPDGDDAAIVRVPLSQGELNLRVDLSGVSSGRLPVITEDAASTAMGELLTVTAGGSLPEIVDGSAVMTATWTPELVADHVAVTDPARRRKGDAVADPAAAAVPDALVGLAWPAVFACIGPVEGLLDLVHLDHRIVMGELPTGTTELTISATRTGVEDTTNGQVISVEVRIWTSSDDGDNVVARLLERFMVRGRTGAAELRAPAPLAKQAKDATRARLDRFTVTAPTHMDAFAAVSGDHNPLHTDLAAARLAGFDAPIAHGMWLSAVAQRRCAPPSTPARSAAGWLAGSPRCSRAPTWRSPSSAPACSTATRSSRSAAAPRASS
jgi:fatty acid synthase